KVYAGVLGKIIGVYLGRPFEGWSYEKIIRDLGEVSYYVHDKCGTPLIVTDDDISGTFTFLRALPDHANSLSLTPEQIGKTWLNYLIERKTILWWGGLGNSTEHTAYLRLKHGITAPQSGSIAVNGPIVAEQIGAQIFIDGWALVSPGDPQRAADLARRAASVSHDGEAIYGAQCLAAMEAQAFTESNIDHLIDTGVSVIPHDSIIYRMISDLRGWHARDNDWRATFQRIQQHYGYDKYIGGCHMVPNHALIILGLLYGEGDFQKSLMICNTCGWDTDCNSGNLGCLMGIRNGLEGFSGSVDWRGPVADRLYLPTMDGGRCVTNAVSETYAIVNSALIMNGEKPIHPKYGARFHFELPGSVQGFRVDPTEPCSAQVVLANSPGHSRSGGRSLSIQFSCSDPDAPARITTPTFILPEDLHMPGYSL
ncbi:MAG: ADP-ribosylglycohydrolase family protein, partial [Anaerolineaceae bacterium]|nr:ADP-ribosylglycohydrolase family protein [Anaerolineaceae bacterium]